MIKGKHVDFHYLVSYRDPLGLPRAWGKAPTVEAADTEAKRQLEMYKAKQAELGEPPQEYTRRVQPCSAEKVDPKKAQPVKPGVAKTSGPKTAKADQPVAPKALEKLRKRVNPNVPGTIQPKADPPSASGQWVCADCGEPFANNAMAHGHTKSHRLAWWTGVHLEEP